MKPLYHPTPGEISVERVLHALSDPIRLMIMVGIAREEGVCKCVDFMHVTEKPIAKSTLSQHFRILREAGLIRSQKHGVELRNSLRCDEMPDAIADLVKAIMAAYAQQLRAPDEAKGKNIA